MLEKDIKRLEDFLISYWENLSTDSTPVESDIDAEILSPIWADCFLVRKVKEKWKYDYLGENLIDAYGSDIDGGEADILISTGANKAKEAFDKAISKKKPVFDSGEFTNLNSQIIKYRQLLLPFQGEDGEVKYVLGGMRWKAF